MLSAVYGLVCARGRAKRCGGHCLVSDGKEDREKYGSGEGWQGSCCNYCLYYLLFTLDLSSSPALIHHDRLMRLQWPFRNVTSSCIPAFRVENKVVTLILFSWPVSVMLKASMSSGAGGKEGDLLWLQMCPVVAGLILARFIR